jgi:hypothetical protein
LQNEPNLVDATQQKDTPSRSEAIRQCGARMLLTRIFPDRLGYDTRIYECPQCEHEVTENPEYKKAG